MRRWSVLATIVIVVALALLVGGCGGDDDDDAVATPPASATPPSAAGTGEPVVDCMAEQGFAIQSPADIDTPSEQQALGTCLESVHSGGGVP